MAELPRAANAQDAATTVTEAGAVIVEGVQYCQPWLRPQESQLLIAPPDRARRLPPRVLTDLDGFFRATS